MDWLVDLRATHKESGGDTANGTNNGDKRTDEINVLNKDVQKLLWKNKMKFPKADDALKLLGIHGPGKKKNMADNEKDFQNLNGCENVDGYGCCAAAADSTIEVDGSVQVLEEDKPYEADVADELRPPKKTKCSNGEACSVQLDDAGQDIQDKEMDQSMQPSIPEGIVEHNVEDNDKCLKLHPREKKLIDFREKLYLAPLTTVGNLPYRRVC